MQGLGLGFGVEGLRLWVVGLRFQVSYIGFRI